MHVETFGPDDGDRVVFVLGWGNRPRHDGVQWLIDRLVDEGYRVDALEIPRTITDFDAEYLQPVRDHVADFEEYRLLTHSTGGLIARFVDDDAMATRTYLSPWWGMHESTRNLLVTLLTKLPISRPILPFDAGREELGELASDVWIADAPDAAAPTFLREAERAQARMPPFDAADAVFYNPDDRIVDAGAIEAQAPAENRIAFEGGHELFNCPAREDHIDAVLAAVDGGIAAL
ncbi:MAG: alpha/beta hydrolase [Haloarculaceae archaeon]